MKKLLLGLGTLSLIALPTLTIISCSSTITTTTSTLTLQGATTTTTAIATAAMDGTPSNANKLILFNLIWTSNPALTEDDMETITFTKKAGTDNTSKFIFTVASTDITLTGNLESGEITLTTNTLTLKDNPVVTTEIASAGVIGANNAAKFALFDAIWTGVPTLDADDMTGITITQKDGTAGAKIFTVEVATGSIVLAGDIESGEITLTTNTLTLQGATTTTTAIATAAMDGTPSNANKLILFNLIWTSNPALTEDDMETITFTKKAGTNDTSKFIFTVTSTGGIVLAGELESGEITLTTTSTLTLQGATTTTTAIATAAMDGTPSNANKLILFNLIWTSNPALTEDDMETITFTKKAGTNDTSKFIFTVEASTGSIILEGELESGEITLTTTSELTLKLTPSVTTEIATAGVAGGAGNPAKFTLFDLIWTGNPTLDADDMTDITITQSDGSAGAKIFTVASTGSIVLEGTKVSGEITLKTTSTLSLTGVSTITTAIATAGTTAGGSTPDNSAKWALFNLIWTTTSSPALTEDDMTDITITQSDGSDGAKIFTVASTGSIVLEGTKVSGEITLKTTSTLSLTGVSTITTAIATAGTTAGGSTPDNSAKWALFNLIWTTTSSPALTEDDMTGITITQSDGSDGAKIFTVASTGSIVLEGTKVSGEITLKTTSTLSLKATPSVTTAIATAGTTAGGSTPDNSAKWALFNLIWTTTSSPALTEDDMTGITITQSDGSDGAKIFTVASTGSIVLEGTKVSGEITLKTTSTLSLTGVSTITTAIATAGTTAGGSTPDNSAKWALFNLIWTTTSSPALTEDDMTDITITQSDGSAGAKIFTVASTGSIVLEGTKVSGEITLKTTSTLSLTGVSTITTAIATAGTTAGGSTPDNSAKWALFNLIWTTTSSPALTEDDMTGITITQSDGSDGAKIFTVASTGSIVLEGTKVSGEITLKTTSTLSLTGVSTITTAIATAGTTAGGSTPDNSAKWALFNLIWTTTSSPALTEDDMTDITITQSDGSAGAKIFTVASTGSIVLEGTKVSGEITLKTTSTLSLTGVSTITTAIATAGTTAGGSTPDNSAKWALFNLIWTTTSSPALTEDDMTDITITQSDGSAGAKIFTVASTGSIVLEGTKVSGEITLKTTSTLSLTGVSTITTAIATAGTTAGGSTPDNSAKWALFNLIWTTTSSPALTEDDMTGITITQSDGSDGAKIFTVASTGSIVLEGTKVSGEITLKTTSTLSLKATPSVTTAIATAGTTAGGSTPDNSAKWALFNLIWTTTSSPALTEDDMTGITITQSDGSDGAKIFTVASTGSIVLEGTKVSGEITLKTTSTLSLKATPSVTTAIATAGTTAGGSTPDNSAKWALFNLIWTTTSSPALTEDDMTGITITQSDGSDGAKIFTVASTGSIVLEGTKVSGEITLKTTSTLSLTGVSTITTAIATAGTTAGGSTPDNSAKWALFNLIWTTTSSPALTEDDMTDITITQSDGSAGAKIFTVASTGSIVLEGTKVSGEITLKTTSTLSLTGVSTITTAIATAGTTAGGSTPDNSAKWALFNLIWTTTSSPALTEDDMTDITITQSDGSDGAKIFTVASTGSIVLEGTKVSGEITLKTTSTLSLKATPSVTTEIASAGIAEGANEAAKFALFDAIWTTTSSPALTVDDMTDITITQSDGSDGAKIFTVASTGSIVLEGTKVSGEITLKTTSTLSLKATPSVTTEIASAGIAEGANEAAKFALFDAIWTTTSSPALTVDDMTDITITQSDGSDGAKIFTVASTGSIVLEGTKVSGEITLKTTSTLSLKATPSVTTEIASAGIAEGANEAAKFALFDAIWTTTSSPALTVDDMTGITITQSDGSAGAKIFTVASTGSIVLEGTKVSGEITLKTTSTLSLKATPSVTTAIATAGTTAGGSTPDNSAKWALFNLIWTTTSSPALTEDDMTGITITQSDGSDGAKIFTVASTGSIVLEGTKVSGEITLTTELTLSLKPTPSVTTEK